MAISESAILKSEMRWAIVVGAIVTIILGAILYAALVMHINPPSNREYVDPKTLHLSAEFTEANLGTKVGRPIISSSSSTIMRPARARTTFMAGCAISPAS